MTLSHTKRTHRQFLDERLVGWTEITQPLAPKKSQIIVISKGLWRPIHHIKPWPNHYPRGRGGHYYMKSSDMAEMVVKYTHKICREWSGDEFMTRADKIYSGLEPKFNEIK